MSTQDPLYVPSVNGAGLTLASRALFAVLATSLAPIVVQSIFGSRAAPAAWLLTAGTALVLGTLLGGLVITRSGVPRGPLAMLAFAFVSAVVVGALLGPTWVLVFTDRPRDLTAAATIFGAFFGAIAGLSIGGLYSLWSGFVSRALRHPSAVSAQRLSIVAGVLLSIAGTTAASTYTSPLGQLAGLGLCLFGALIVLGAVLRTSRLKRIFSMAERGDLTVEPRSEHHRAPALAWAPVIDRVILRRVAPNTAEPGPFRAQLAADEIATIPSDLTVVSRALRHTMALGLGVLGAILATVALTGLLLLPSTAACCSSGRPCHSHSASAPCHR